MGDGAVPKPELPVVLVASTGGHLEQLYLWAEKWQLTPDGPVRWVTFDGPQSRSLLRGWAVDYVDYVSPRDLKGTLAAVPTIRRAIRQLGAQRVVSTGASIAVAGAIAARGTGARVTYIESLARAESLSLTGRILRWVPGIERFAQSPALADRRMAFRGNILDDYHSHAREPRGTHGLGEVKSVVVSVGTIKPYGFDRLISRLEEVLEGCSVEWQIGESNHWPHYGKVSRSLDREELLDSMRDADAVVTHAGVGSILSSLSAGKVPVVVPRRMAYEEHVDNHQQAIADLLSPRGLVIEASADSITLEHLQRAAALTVVRGDRAGGAA